MNARIPIPAAVRRIAEFLAPPAASSGDGVEIIVNANGATFSACDGRHAVTIETPASGSCEPFRIAPEILAGGKTIFMMPNGSVVVESLAGELVDVATESGELSPSARATADRIEGEIVTGMVGKLYDLDPRHLRAAADAMVEAGVEKCSVAIADRHNVLAIVAQAAGEKIAMFVAGEESPPQNQSPSPMAFTVQPVGRKKTVASSPRSQPAADDWMPDDIPF